MKQITAGKGAQFDPLIVLTAVIVAIPSALLLLKILSLCRFGYDFTDEASYLNSIAYPSTQPRLQTQFGWAYQPIYWLSGKDVPLLRQINVFLVWLLSFFMFALILRRSGIQLPAISRLSLAAAFGTAGLSLFSLWLLTPSYNSLNLQALLLTACGVVAIDSRSRFRSTCSRRCHWCGRVALPDGEAFVGGRIGGRGAGLSRRCRATLASTGGDGIDDGSCLWPRSGTGD